MADHLTPQEIARLLPPGHVAITVADRVFDEILSRIQPQLRWIPTPLADAGCRCVCLPTVRDFVVIPASVTGNAPDMALIEPERG